jgi:ubiquinone/menaquinone biosynthesis C-methylase UbiE
LEKVSALKPLDVLIQQWKSHGGGAQFKKVLEVGSGEGEHLDFVEHGFNEYVMLDLRKTELDSKWNLDERIKTLEGNAESLPFETGEFDRVISTCLLHHVERPELVLSEIERVLSPNGTATIFLSCDPGLMVRILRRVTTARSAKSKGFRGYNLMIAREHRNHFGSILEIAQFVFRDRALTVKYYPFVLGSWNLNGYAILTIRKVIFP